MVELERQSNRGDFFKIFNIKNLMPDGNIYQPEDLKVNDLKCSIPDIKLGSMKFEKRL